MHRLAALTILFTAAVAHADEPPPPRSIVLADLGLHVIGAGVQHGVTERVALQVDADFYSPWTQLLHDDQGAQDTVGAVLRARVFWYVTRAAPEGWWVSPFVQAGFARGDTKAKLAAAIGAAVGYAWLLPHDIALAVGAGVQYHDVETTPGFRGVWPHADLNVGYAF